MKRFIVPLFSLLVLSCGSSPGSGGAPTEDDITKAMHAQYDMPGDNLSPRHDIEIHSIKIGDTEGTNEQDKIDGIPAKADVTMAKVDFTERSYYTDKTTTRRREITAKVYKDDFGDWKVMTDASREISSADEPAKP